MARIELSFYDKDYVIEFNRASIKEFFKLKSKKSDDELDEVVALIKCGLVMHHKDDMPSDEDVFGWVLAMGESIKDFASALHEMVQDTLTTLETDRKNLKWGKVQA